MKGEVKSESGVRVLFLRISFVPFLLLPVRLFIDGLVARGHEVTLIKTRPRDQRTPEEARPHIRNVLLELRSRNLPKSRLVEPLVFAEFIVRSIWHGLRSRPHLVVAIDLDTLLPALIIARLRRVPLVYYSLELYTERPGGFRPKWLWVWLERRLINLADLVVACEPHRARFMQEHYGAKTMPMVVLNVPPRQERRSSTKIADYVRAAGGTATKFLYYHGVISRTRCAEIFIQALEQLPEEVGLFFVGPIDAAYQEQLDAMVRQAGLSGRVFFGGIVPAEELLDYAASASIGLQVQMNDGLNHYYCAPIKLFQYFSVGLPVIASNFPGMIDVVERNGAGLCVEPSDVSALAAAARRILASLQVENEMSDQAFALSRSQYCHEIEGEKLFQAVETLLNPGAEQRSV